MGTWGKGNFDSDTAADHLGILMQRLVDEVGQAMSGPSVEIEPDEYWGTAVPCNLEILHLLAQQRWVGVTLPDTDTLEGWKAKFLEVWDEEIDNLGPSRSFKKERREVLVRTFDQLLALVADDEAEASVPRAAPPKAPKKKAKPAKKAAPAKKKAAPAKKKAAPAKKKAASKKPRR